MKTKISIWWLLIITVVLFALLKQCEPKPIIKTETIHKDRIDTIKVAEISEKEIPVYIERTKTVKGKDSIIYRDKPTENTINANVYEAIVKTDSSSAELQITSLTRPLDVRGVIKCKEKITTITKQTAQSGLFLYFEAPLNKTPERFELGVDYVIKNSLLTGLSFDYNTITKSVNANFKVGIKL